jgi:predicted DNA binding protein
MTAPRINTRRDELTEKRSFLRILTLFEIDFRAQHDCPYNDLSRANPRAVIAHWCNFKRDVLEIKCDDVELFQRIQYDVSQLARSLGGKILRKGFSANNVQLVIRNCGCANIKNSITRTLQDHNCLEIQPTIYKDGWEWYRAISFNQQDIRKFFSSLEAFAKVEVLSRRTIKERTMREALVISTTSLLGGLTEKQASALIAALNEGYYRIPKKITTDEIAQRLGIPRTTFEEHLRKAESKVLVALTPYLQLGAERRG